MIQHLTAAHRLYDAIAAHDRDAILDALDPAFVGEASDGMPLGVGGRHEGGEAMLREVWGPILRAYDVRVDAEQYLPCADAHVVVVGRYRGTERATGRPLDAAFAHVLTVRDDRVASLRQITDTRAWPQA
jgi:2-(1,2-epoxy-1,2-dihydrophenyl)acetyl-CoA isomerase